MPNLKVQSLNTTAVGVDGCRGGWLAAVRKNNSRAITWARFETWSDLINGFDPRPQIIAVDMPIGLIDCGRRNCDTKARALLERAPKSSIFAPPRRPMLQMGSYEEANRWGQNQGPNSTCGGGISKQAWNLVPKIVEIDDWIRPARQDWVIEAHPELAFDNAVTKSAIPIDALPSKKTLRGQVIRAQILTKLGISLPPIAEFPTDCKGAQMDDFLDAAVLLFVAERKLKGEACCLPQTPQLDSLKLRMEIWY